MSRMVCGAVMQIFAATKVSRLINMVPSTVMIGVVLCSSFTRINAG